MLKDGNLRGKVRKGIKWKKGFRHKDKNKNNKVYTVLTQVLELG